MKPILLNYTINERKYLLYCLKALTKSEDTKNRLTIININYYCLLTYEQRYEYKHIIQTNNTVDQEKKIQKIEIKTFPVIKSQWNKHPLHKDVIRQFPSYFHNKYSVAIT